MQGLTLGGCGKGTLLPNTNGLYASVSLPKKIARQCSQSYLFCCSSLNGNSAFSSKRLLLACSSIFAPQMPWSPLNAANASSTVPRAFSAPLEEVDRAKLVSRRLELTSRYFRKLGGFGFWSQLVCTMVSAVILSFSSVITGKISSPTTFYATAGGIIAAFLSVFWSFGYIRLSEQLKKTANDPAKAPHRAEVLKSLRNGVILNMIGMGAAIVGIQSNLGVLVAKALISSSFPLYQSSSPSRGPILALDVFLVQASVGAVLSHYLGLISSLELLRSVTVPASEGNYIPRHA